MLLSEIIKAAVVNARDLSELLDAAERIDVYIHLNGPTGSSLVFIDKPNAAIVSIHPLTKQPRPEIKVCSQEQYWQLNHNPWLD